VSVSDLHVRLGIPLFCQYIIFFIPHVAVSAWHLKCTIHMGTNIVVVH